MQSEWGIKASSVSGENMDEKKSVFQEDCDVGSHGKEGKKTI